MVEVVALHDHVVEFQEGQALLHALLVAFGAQHVVHAEAGANFTQQLNVVQVQQPVSVVQHHGLAFAKLNKALHLALKALGVMVNVFFGQHFAHVGTARRVTDHGGAAANQGNGLIACHLQALHQGQGHKVAGGQAVGCAVKADVESSLAVVDYFLDFFLVRYLGNQAAGFQFVINGHGVHPPWFVRQGQKIKRPCQMLNLAEGDQIRGTTSVCPCLTATGLRGCGSQSVQLRHPNAVTCAHGPA